MSEQPITLSPEGNVAVLRTPGVQAVVTMKGLPTVPNRAGATPTQAVVKPELTAGSGDIVYWGAGNDFPQQINRLVEKSTIIGRALTDVAALWIGGGVIATIDGKSEDMVDDQEIHDFLTSSMLNRYLTESALSMAKYWNFFPEMVLSKDRSEIVQLHCLKTAYCRWGRMDPRTGELNTVYMSATWPSGSEADPDVKKLVALTPTRWDLAQWVREQNGYKYVYPMNFPSDDRSYYSLAAWDAARTSGWLDVMEAIPQFKKYAMKNQITLRIHFEVPDEYWERVYEDRWDQADFSGKMAIRDEFLTAMMEKLAGVENANKGILTDMFIGRDGKPTGVKINILDDKHKEGKFNEDYSDGGSHVLHAIGYEPALFGFSAGKEGSWSGGSNKREAFWIFISKSKPFRDRILEPIQFIAEYNGWKKRYPKLRFKFVDTLLTTLDTGKSTATVNTPA